LLKRSKPVTEMTKKLNTLIGDLLDTMYEAQGAGLAAPQVGILKRVFVVDCSEDGSQPIVLINPEILWTEGTQTGDEGCLSYPGKAGVVTRPNLVRIRGFNRNMEPVEYEGTEVLARAFCHEMDHLDGRLYTEFVEGDIHDSVPKDKETKGK